MSGLTSWLKKSVRRTAHAVFTRYRFAGYAPEDLARREFFYGAFAALSFNGIDGDYAEFGCCGGTTFSMAFHECRQRGLSSRLWAFDSFEGLPPIRDSRDPHAAWDEGTLKMTQAEFRGACARNKIPTDAYEMVPGFYEQTLKEDSGRNLPSNIALAYVDCDMYTSTKEVLEFLATRLKHGMIIAFDDYFCFSPESASGEKLAMEDVFGSIRGWQLVPFIQYGWFGQSFVVEDRRNTASGQQGPTNPNR